MPSSFIRRLMLVNSETVVRKLRSRRLLPKSAGDKLLDRIPAVALADIVNDPIISVAGTYTYRDGYLPWCDLLALMSLLVDRSPRSILEIGTFNGYTTRLMARNLPQAEIHTIDLPEDFNTAADSASAEMDDFHLIAARKVGSEYRADPSIRSIHQHFGDTAEYPFPPAEFCFIDGSHTYAYARNDTEKALASGVAKTLVWHDCDRFHTGVSSWLLEMIAAGHPVRRIRGTNLAFLDVQGGAIKHSERAVAG